MLLSTFVICSKVDCLKNMVWGHIASDICKENYFQRQRLHLVMGRKMKEGKKKKKKKKSKNGFHSCNFPMDLMTSIV